MAAYWMKSRAFALRTPAEILEIGLPAQQKVVQLRLFGGQLVALGRQGLALGLRRGRFFGHFGVLRFRILVVHCLYFT